MANTPPLYRSLFQYKMLESNDFFNQQIPFETRMEAYAKLANYREFRKEILDFVEEHSTLLEMLEAIPEKAPKALRDGLHTAIKLVATEAFGHRAQHAVREFWNIEDQIHALGA